jgi:hypothetical protein
MTQARHAKSETTVDAVQIPPPNVVQSHPPEFLRLPPPGQLCAWTGLSRSALNELILGTPRNNFKPVVRSFCLRQRGAKTGIRLVDYSSLAAHIRSNPETGTKTNGSPRKEADGQ